LAGHEALDFSAEKTVCFIVGVNFKKECGLTPLRVAAFTLRRPLRCNSTWMEQRSTHAESRPVGGGLPVARVAWKTVRQ
jgi:hypothetical protein